MISLAINKALHRWLDELSALIPPAWLHKQEDRLAIRHADRLEFWHRTANDIAPLAAPDHDPAPLLLRLSGHVWRRTYQLPRAARPFLGQIFTNEMDRRTPWRADQVYFALSSRPDPDDRTALQVTLTLTPRNAVAAALDQLNRLGLQADRLELSDAPDPRQSGPVVALQDGRPVALAGKKRLRPVYGLLGLATLGLIGLIVQGIWLTLLAAQTAAAQQDVQAVRRLSGEIAARERREHFPTEQRRQTPPLLGVLNALARALPDDSWTEEIDLTPTRIEAIGISTDATRLLALLDATPPLSAAEFRAPVTPAEGGGQKFHLAAQIAAPTEAAHAAP